ncbi:hypothetical protein [Alkalicoccus chagannorensis]|uniref:hypothetical protein n=1 Tax=Alkalicoccus chagannorensis TaxID=427072 RepID=UPI0003F7F79C|nr:hypothetical protein [Alkalicoccus chagannorensis]
MKKAYIVLDNSVHAEVFDLEGVQVTSGTLDGYLSEWKSFDVVFLFVDGPGDGAARLRSMDPAQLSSLIVLVPEASFESCLPLLQFHVLGLYRKAYFLDHTQSILEQAAAYPAGACERGAYKLAEMIDRFQGPGEGIRHFRLRESALPSTLKPTSRQLLEYLLDGETSQTIKEKYGYTQGKLQYARERLMLDTGTENLTEAVVHAVREGWTEPVRSLIAVEKS